MDITENDTGRRLDATEDYAVVQELGDCYASVGNYMEAHKCYEKAAGLEPDEPGPYVGLGVVALQKNLLEDAEIAFRVACRLDANCSKAWSGLAMVAQQRGDYKQAFEMYLKCLELDVDNLIALLGLFQTSCQMGSFAKVIHYLQLYLKMHPGDTSVMFPLAALYMKDNKLKQSKKILSEILTLDPENKDAANLLEEVEHGLAKAQQKGIKIG
ncbi:MAG: tetratricopeptide repeat protein [Phycisphaerae bacterium]|nr:tetratricopeptide repeat protein [Phycisphaerae bacterium]NIP52897.1 tetratricopeptide repeat protein [Phycisphaerae bacterium]NIS51948.1 tetratricopeptide repeat protein [Phycisphaerae bacterium]NIU09462.1 tetratricopeptide repeat protein [Phycisphaerae bacterium]NIU57195.1 tetratricopeptide repeat protein [Phycisphaerae bacterium]